MSRLSAVSIYSYVQYNSSCYTSCKFLNATLVFASPPVVISLVTKIYASE